MRSTHASRSLKKIGARDLSRLATLAAEDRADFVTRYRRTKLRRAYRCTALCQGAALHYLDGQNGIKDFDVWTFYSGGVKTFPPRRTVSVDFGRKKFGTSSDRPDFVGRRVDLLGRGIPFRAGRKGEGIVEALRSYLSRGESVSARKLAEKAVILVDPPHLMGRIVWPIPLEDKLATLAACGIKRRRGVSVLDIARANLGGRLEAGERVSYLDVVERLGSERAMRPHDFLSDNVHLLDPKCVRKPDAYTEILRRMVHMARGRFPVRRISSHIDFETATGEARFVLGPTEYQMPIHVDRAWIDGNFLSSFARLLRKVDRTLRYIELSAGDYYFVIGCVTNSEMKLLSKHTDLSFAELDNLSF